MGYMTGWLFAPHGATQAYILGGALDVLAGLAGWLLFIAIKPRSS
ncbi:hypothetical protein WBP06_19180 [Novosphingobium sp. BL-8H]